MRLVFTVLLLVGTIHVSHQCNLPIGDRVTGETVLDTVTISKGPLAEAQSIELDVDYKVSPLQNAEIIFVQLTSSDSGCSAIISNAVDRKVHLLGTVKSANQVTEFSVTIVVYGLAKGDQ